MCISKTPACSCLFFLSGKGKKICKHIVMVQLRLGVGEDDPLLYQVGYTNSELDKFLRATFSQFVKKRRTIDLVSHVKPKHKLYLFDYQKGTKRGRRNQCTECKKLVPDGLVVAVEGKYRYGNHSRDYIFYYCLDDHCLTNPPKNSDICNMPQTILSTYATEGQRDMALNTVKFDIS